MPISPNGGCFYIVNPFLDFQGLSLVAGNIMELIIMAAKARVLQDLTSVSNEDLLKILAERGIKTEAPKEVQITLGDFQGHATVTFNIPGKRPFYVSVNKLKAIFEHEKTVRQLIKGK